MLGCSRRHTASNCLALATTLGDGCDPLGVVLVLVFGVVVVCAGVVAVVVACVGVVGVAVVCAGVVVVDVGVVFGAVALVVGTVAVWVVVGARVVVGTFGRVSAVAVGVVARWGVEERVVVSADLCEPPQPAINSATATIAADTIFGATAVVV